MGHGNLTQSGFRVSCLNPTYEYEKLSYFQKTQFLVKHSLKFIPDTYLPESLLLWISQADSLYAPRLPPESSG